MHNIFLIHNNCFLYNMWHLLDCRVMSPGSYDAILRSKWKRRLRSRNYFPFWSPWVHLGVLMWFVLLHKLLYIIVCNIILFRLAISWSVVFDLRLLITPLVSSNFSLDKLIISKYHFTSTHKVVHALKIMT